MKSENKFLYISVRISLRLTHVNQKLKTETNAISAWVYDDRSISEYFNIGRFNCNRYT